MPIDPIDRLDEATIADRHEILKLLHLLEFTNQGEKNARHEQRNVARGKGTDILLVRICGMAAAHG